MKGLLNAGKNTLMDFKAHISLKRLDFLKDSKDTADCLSNRQWNDSPARNHYK